MRVAVALRSGLVGACVARPSPNMARPCRTQPPTPDGQSFMVDGSADVLAAIPESHRSEVQRQLVMLQRLAASALGVAA